jgi:hypothetical protein
MEFYLRKTGPVLLGCALVFAVAASAQRAPGNAGHVGSVSLHAGDLQAELHGTQLNQVATVSVAGVEFLPAALRVPKGTNATEELSISAQTMIRLVLGRQVGVDIAFKDGRVAHFDVIVGPPRPLAELGSKSVEGAADNGLLLANASDVPQGSTLVFTARLAKGGEPTAMEVAFEDDSRSTELTAANGGLSGLTGRVSLAKAFGAATFGPLKFRVIEGETASDWVPLATLVRLPHLASIQCPADLEQQCTLTGSNLFLLESVGAEASYVQSVDVPAKFTGSSLKVPYPTENGMAVKLRDDPSQPNQVTLHVNVAAAAVPAK